MPGQKSVAQQSKTEYINFDSLRPVFPAFTIDTFHTELKEDSVFLTNSGVFTKDMWLSDSLNVLMDTLSKLNKSIPFYGYRIVLFTGSDRNKAIIERGKALKLLEGKNTEVYMNYQQPYFKVKVGNFYDRITAYTTYLMLKESIPTALLVPEIIDLNKIQFK